MQQLHTLKDIEQAIATHPLVSLYIKAPICGVCTVVAAQLDSPLAVEGNVYAVKADADLPTLQNFADRSAATSPVLNSLKARAKVVVEKI